VPLVAWKVGSHTFFLLRKNVGRIIIVQSSPGQTPANRGALPCPLLRRSRGGEDFAGGRGGDAGGQRATTDSAGEHCGNGEEGEHRKEGPKKSIAQRTVVEEPPVSVADAGKQKKHDGRGKNGEGESVIDSD
jgi:hypothetical protein